MVSSIGYSLGIGSGLDIKSLVEGLAEAQKAPKEALIKRREDLNQARLSALSEVSGAIDNFATALSSLIAGGSLFSQPSVSDSSVLSASAVRGAQLTALSSEIEVVQLARAQTLQSEPLASRTAAVGEGSLTLHTASGAHTVIVDGANNTLEGLAQAINDKKAGVTASIVTDSNGARLVLKGATGEAQAFTVEVPAGTSSGLERFAFGADVAGGMTVAQTAQDAVLLLDNVEVKRASNSFNDLLPGVQIDLKRAAPGTKVSLGLTRPTAAIEQAMGDFVSAYNELQALIAEKTKAGVGPDGGPLRGDLGVRELQRQLAQLTTQTLASQGDGPKTLAAIGVRTNRDGTLGLNLPQLKQLLATDANGVEALFNPSQWSSNPAIAIKSEIGRVKPGIYTVTDLAPEAAGSGATGFIDGKAMISSGPNLIGPVGSAAVGLILGVGAAASSVTITIDPGLGGALQSIRDALRTSGGPFANSSKRLQAEARDIADDRVEMETRASTYYDQLLGRFTTMERQVSAAKATQSYLEQQIKIWTADRG